MIDDYEAYFGGKITQLQDAFTDGEKTKDELEGDFAVLDDEMTDAFEDGDLTDEAYKSLSGEIAGILSSATGS